MICLICVDLLLDDYGKPELEPSYYDYDVLDDADKGKNIYNDLNLLRFFKIQFIILCRKTFLKHLIVF